MNLNQVTVPSSDVSRSIDFYQRLGLRLIVEDLPHYARFECPNGDATFSVEQRAASASGAGIVVYFECENVDSVVAALRQLGVGVEAEPKDQPWLWREAYLRDPDGNSLCLFTAGKNRKYPPWRVPGS
jgi:catechol 2,3-dioxygenase-like lactoylglutathione lyase family enzyme